jgi:hypothetical protein
MCAASSAGRRNCRSVIYRPGFSRDAYCPSDAARSWYGYSATSASLHTSGATLAVIGPACTTIGLHGISSNRTGLVGNRYRPAVATQSRSCNTATNFFATTKSGRTVICTPGSAGHCDRRIATYISGLVAQGYFTANSAYAWCQNTACRSPCAAAGSSRAAIDASGSSSGADGVCI